MKRRTIEQVSERIQSRKIARTMGLPIYRGRHLRRDWADVARTYGTGRYRWLRVGLRAELMRLRMNETPWPWGMTA